MTPHAAYPRPGTVYLISTCGECGGWLVMNGRGAWVHVPVGVDASTGLLPPSYPAPTDPEGRAAPTGEPLPADQRIYPETPEGRSWRAHTQIALLGSVGHSVVSAGGWLLFAAVIVGGYLAWVAVDPSKRCRVCNGTGELHSWLSRGAGTRFGRRCWCCKGAKRHPRLGSRLTGIGKGRRS